MFSDGMTDASGNAAGQQNSVCKSVQNKFSLSDDGTRCISRADMAGNIPFLNI